MWIILVGDVKANPRDFYRYISCQKKDTQGIPPLKRKNGKGVAQSDLEFFYVVFSSPEPLGSKLSL